MKRKIQGLQDIVLKVGLPTDVRLDTKIKKKNKNQIK